MSKENITSTWIDPDDAPPLTREHFERAEIRKGDQVIRRGRPKSDNPKEAISLRLDSDLVSKLRESGPGWQTRVNNELRKVVGL